jgi:hypothetical protein
VVVVELVCQKREPKREREKHQSWHTSHAVLPISSGRFRLDFLARVEVAAAAARALPAIKDSRLMAEEGRGETPFLIITPADAALRVRFSIHESNAISVAFSLFASIYIDDVYLFTLSPCSK